MTGTPMTVAEQQQAIVDASLELLASGGPQALRVRDIAAAAGCTTMTVYSRFGGKDGVVEAIYVDGFRRFTHALTEVAPGPSLERGHRLGLAYRSWALANRGSYQVMFTEAVPGFTPSDDAAFVAIASFEVLVDAVKDMQADGHIRAGEALEIAWAVWGLTHGLVMLELAAITPTKEPIGSLAVYENALLAVVRGFAP